MSSKYLKYFILGLFLLLVPKVCFGLAGFGEIDYDCIYTPNIGIYFGDPSDLCTEIENKSQTCLLVHYPATDDSFNFKYYRLDPLTEINIPENNKPKFIFGKSYIDNKWLIFDINKNVVVFSDSKYDAVLNKWRDLGNQDPKFANTKNFLKNFSETEYSKKSNGEHEKFMEGMVSWIFINYGLPILVGFLVTLLLVVAIDKKIRANKL